MKQEVKRATFKFIDIPAEMLGRAVEDLKKAKKEFFRYFVRNGCENDHAVDVDDVVAVQVSRWVPVWSSGLEPNAVDAGNAS